MAKTRSIHECRECGAQYPKWTGRCTDCGSWNTLEEQVIRPSPNGLNRMSLSDGGGVDRSTRGRAVALSEVPADEWRHRSTGVAEFDRVLSGGFVAGSVTLVGGEPGVGKSTLLLQVAAAYAASPAGEEGPVLYVSAEESQQQVRLRAERLGALSTRVLVASENDIASIVDLLDEHSPCLLVVDSIQTVFDSEIGSAPGTVTQVRESASRLTMEAKRRGVPTVLVGHVTKDGGLAGPRVLEHIVDTVLGFEGDRQQGLRLLRPVKNRFGSTSEVGVFQMRSEGLVAVPDPSALFLADRREGLAGSAVVSTLQASRPFLVEVQALGVPRAEGSAARATQGIDKTRLCVLVAVCERVLGESLSRLDIYASAVGGTKVKDPGADLGICAAVVSSITGAVIPGDIVACGEIGLAGELRQVGQIEARLAEARRLGFKRIVVPPHSGPVPPGLEVVPAPDLGAALTVLGLTGGTLIDTMMSHLGDATRREQ